MCATTTPFEHESDRPLRNFKLLDIILEFAGVKASASAARVDKFLRQFALLKYGFINEDSTGKISNVIDESCFAAAWDFLKHAEDSIRFRIDYFENRIERKYPPEGIEVTLHLFCFFGDITRVYRDNRRRSDLYRWEEFDMLLRALIPSTQLKQKHVFRTDVTSNGSQGLLGEMRQNEKALKILQEFLFDVRMITGISSTQCWKSALKWKVYKNDISILIKNVFKGIFLILLLLLMTGPLLLLCADPKMFLILRDSIRGEVINEEVIKPRFLLFISSFEVSGIACLLLHRMGEWLDASNFSGLSGFSDKGQYDRGDQWLRFFHKSVPKLKKEQEAELIREFTRGV